MQMQRPFRLTLYYDEFLKEVNQMFKLLLFDISRFTIKL
jgi:hypothetical protein